MSIAYAAEKSAQVAVETSSWHAISSASPIVQLTLLILIAMSVISWAIIVQKRKMFIALNEANKGFEDRFWKAKALEEVYEHMDEHVGSPMAKVFKSGFVELKKIAESTRKGDDSAPTKPMLSGIDNLERSLHKAVENELSFMEYRLSILATVGSVGPFIGLFGTVWGIMGSFHKIGQTGVASLAVVAPGISEALIATGVGLFAAIPATMAYNLFVTRLKKEELVLNNFGADFLNIAKRNFFRES
jgi:biopolymer transport protein TolQ